jgi:hypothetical protein
MNMMSPQMLHLAAKIATGAQKDIDLRIDGGAVQQFIEESEFHGLNNVNVALVYGMGLGRISNELVLASELRRGDRVVYRGRAKTIDSMTTHGGEACGMTIHWHEDDGARTSYLVNVDDAFIALDLGIDMTFEHSCLIVKVLRQFCDEHATAEEAEMIEEILKKVI